MKRTALLLALFLAAIITIQAQTFTQRLQTPSVNKGTVSITHDAIIDKLVNGHSIPAAATQPAKPEASKPSTATSTATKESAKPKPAAPKADAKKPNSAQQQVNTPDEEPTASTPTLTKKVNGYRVQVYAGTNGRADKQKVNGIAHEIKSLFPSEPVYGYYQAPRWICRMGNYTTYEEAYQRLLEVKGLGYGQASVVKCKVTVEY